MGKQQNRMGPIALGGNRRSGKHILGRQFRNAEFGGNKMQEWNRHHANGI